MSAAGGNISTQLFRKWQWLDYITVTWHALAAITSITAGIVADSLALSGFGLSSVIQAAVAALVLWRLQLQARGQMGKDEQTTERKILFILGVSFFLLSLYILHESGSKLFYKEKPQTSNLGIVLSCLTFFAMTALAVLKIGSARALHSKKLRAAAKENLIGIYPSLILFWGLSLHSKYGWWWADAVSTLFMLPFLLRQGWKAIESSKESTFARETSKII